MNNNMNNINNLLEKYWEVETTLEEEKVLRDYFTSEDVAPEHLAFVPLFQHFDDTKVTSSLDVESIIMGEIAKEKQEPIMKVEKPKGKVVGIRKYIPMVAAASILMLVAIVGIRQYTEPSYSGINSNMVVLESEEDTEEAVRITKEALALLSNGYNKGTEAVKELQHMKVANQLIND